VSNSPGLLEESVIGASGTLVVIEAGDGGIDAVLRFFRRTGDTRLVLFFVADFLVVFPALVVFLAGFLPDCFAAERFEGDFLARFLTDDFRDFLLVFLATMVISYLHSTLWQSLDFTTRFFSINSRSANVCDNAAVI
jgi:hypothetical protein